MILTWAEWLALTNPGQAAALAILALVYLGGMGTVASIARRAWKDRPADLPRKVRVRFLIGSVLSTLFWPYIGGQALATRSLGALGGPE